MGCFWAVQRLASRQPESGFEGANFKSPLIGTMKLTTEHTSKCIRSIRELGSQYGYEYDLKTLPSVRMVTAAAVPGDPDVITFGS